MRYRNRLPQLEGELFLTDGGIETTLIFHEGHELPLFAAVDLLRTETGTAALRRYFEPYAELAAERGTGLVLESPTWRASPRWAAELGWTPAELDALNVAAIELLAELRERYEDRIPAVVISGCVGPHGDGYSPAELLDADAAAEYHATQIATFARTEADMVTAITMTYADEAIGVARAAAAAGLPCAISFTVETDGALPDGRPLREAIEQVDAQTAGAPAYYMVNCAHPTHFADVLDGGEWCRRIRGVRANASAKSHAELDEATELDEGDPADFGARSAALRAVLPNLSVLGGCCGTDDRHVRAAAEAW